MKNDDPWYMVVEARLPTYISGTAYSGIAYAIFPTKEQANRYRKDNNIESITNIIEA